MWKQLYACHTQWMVRSDTLVAKQCWRMLLPSTSQATQETYTLVLTSSSAKGYPTSGYLICFVMFILRFSVTLKLWLHFNEPAWLRKQELLGILG